MIFVFVLFEKVRIKSKKTVGTIVDISDGVYVVESDEKGKRSDGYGGDYPIFDCSESDLERVK